MGPHMTAEMTVQIKTQWEPTWAPQAGTCAACPRVEGCPNAPVGCPKPDAWPKAAGCPKPEPAADEAAAALPQPAHRCPISSGAGASGSEHVSQGADRVSRVSLNCWPCQLAGHICSLDLLGILLAVLYAQEALRQEFSLCPGSVNCKIASSQCVTLLYEHWAGCQDPLDCFDSQPSVCRAVEDSHSLLGISCDAGQRACELGPTREGRRRSGGCKGVASLPKAATASKHA